MNIEKSKNDAEVYAKASAEHQADYDDLKRSEPIVLAECISDARVYDSGTTYQWIKNKALQNSKYQEHLKKMKESQSKYLEAEKNFRVIVQFLKAVESENWKRHAEIKAGIL